MWVLTVEVLPTEDKSQFVNITDVVPDAILEIRYYSTYNFVGARVDGYEQPMALMTKQAADSLKVVSDELRELGYRIKIWDSYRPQTAVNHFVRWAEILQDTTMNESGSEIIADTTGRITPMEGIFVQAEQDGEILTFTTEAPANNGKGLTLSISQAGGVIDRAIIRFGEGYQLPKFQMRSNSTKVYIPQDGKDYAVVNVGRDAVRHVSTEIPVNFKAKENGTYTLSFSSEEVSFNYLHLIDNMTGNDIDLLQTPSYSFEAKTTDYASRFRLVFSICEDANGDNVKTQKMVIE